MKLSSLVVGVIAVASLVVGCGGSSSSSRALYRIVHASPDAGVVDVFVNDEALFPNVPYLGATDYESIRTGNANFRVNPDGSGTSVIDADLSLAKDDVRTIIAAGKAAPSGGEPGIQPIVLIDDLDNPATGNVKVRLVHGSPTAGPVDIYVTAPGDPLPATPNFSDVLFGQNTGYVTLPDGNYRVRITPANSGTVVIDSGAVTLNGRAIRTIIARDNAGGGAPYGALTLVDKN